MMLVPMDLARTRSEIEHAMVAPAATLGRRTAQEAFRFGLEAGVGIMTPLAGVLVLGFMGSTYATGQVPFSPWALPLLLVLVPLARGMALWSAQRRMPPSGYEAALLIDANNDNQDRISTALEFASDPASDGADRRAALARVAVADGRASLPHVDLDRVEYPRETSGFRWGLAMLAILIALFPAVLDSIATESTAIAATPDGLAPAVARTSGSGVADAADPTAQDAVRRAREAVSPRVPGAPRAPTGAPRGNTPPAANPQATNAGAGQGAQPAPASATAQTSESAAARSEAKGSSSSSGSGASGKGAASSESGSDKQPDETAKPSKPKATPQKSAETERSDKEPSAGSPSGNSRGGGRLAAVGNERSGVDRGVERDDDLDSEDEDVEDDKEETEQRGGVVPSRRDRRSAATRELTISGNGPPSDGRGGPTPPKKSRGTASLVLGIRLPDQVRGRPNPGTAKTSIEPVPPTPSDALARSASASPSDGPSPHVQSIQPPIGARTDFLRRYHELVRARSSRDEPKTRDE